MWFRTRFDTLLARSSRTRSRKRRLAPSFRRRSRSFRPLLDILEDRTLLSTYTVNSLTDTGAGSGLAGDLRYCITHATSGNDTITFASALQGTINLASALDLNASVAIQGPGDNPGGLGSRLNVGGGQILVGSTATVAISGLGIYTGDILNLGTLTVSGCNIGDPPGIRNGGTATVSDCYFGGDGINNSGTMTISNSIFAGFYGSAGGIANSGTLTLNYSTLNGIIGGIIGADTIFNQGALTINNSSLTNNVSAGGVIYMSAGTLSINSSTLAGNGVLFGTACAALYIAGGTVSINNSTIADNHGYPSSGGGIINAADPSALQMYDTILADNSYGDLNGGVISLGHNLIGNSTGGSGFAASDLLDVNPLLGPLQNNGGASAGVPLAQQVVQTMALLAGSPALNAGDPSQLGVPDQRGVLRTGGVNIGAYQASASALLLSALDTVQAGVSFDVTVTAVDPFNQVAVGYTGTVTFNTSYPDPGVVLPADYTFTLDDGGTHRFTDTGLGETTLVTPGPQTLTVLDTADDTIAGSASVTVSAAPGPAPSGQRPPPSRAPACPAQAESPPRSEPAANAVVPAEQGFISFHDGNSAWLIVPRLRHQARGQTDSALAEQIDGAWGVNVP